MTINDERRQLCTFRVGPLFLAIDVADVQEVLYEAVVTEVPLAHSSVAGLINLRGQIASAIDLRSRLGLPPAEEGSSCIHVVVLVQGEPTSLRVDRIGDVLAIEPGIFEPAPETLEPSMRDFIIGAFKLDSELLLILDVARTVALNPTAEVAA